MKGTWLIATTAGLLVSVPYAYSFVRYYSEVLGGYPSCAYFSSALVALSFLMGFGLTYVVADAIAEKKAGAN